MDKSQESNQNENSQGERPWPTLPTHMQHKMSMKWTTLEALRILQTRLRTREINNEVLLLTSMGPVHGQLADITDDYEDGVSGNQLPEIDVASAVVHLRTELWNMYAKKDSQLSANDSGAVIHLKNASFRVGSRNVVVDHMGIFVDEVVGFSLMQPNVVH